MSKTKRSTIEVKGAAVAVLSQNYQDFICITDIARYKDAERRLPDLQLASQP